MASSSRSSDVAGNPISQEAVTVQEEARRTSEQRGKLGVAPAAGHQARKKKQSIATSLAKGDLKEIGRQSMEFVRSPIRALAGGRDGQEAAKLRGMTFNLADLDPDADGDGVVSAFEQAVYERIQRIDKDGDGKLSVHELYDVVEEAVAAKQACAGDGGLAGTGSPSATHPAPPHPTRSACHSHARFAHTLAHAHANAHPHAHAHAPRACAFVWQ